MNKINFDKWKESIDKNIDEKKIIVTSKSLIKNNSNKRKIKDLMMEKLDLEYETSYSIGPRNKRILIDEENSYDSFKLMSELYMKETERTEEEKINREKEKIEKETKIKMLELEENKRKENVKNFLEKELENHIKSLNREEVLRFVKSLKNAI